MRVHRLLASFWIVVFLSLLICGTALAQGEDEKTEAVAAETPDAALEAEPIAEPAPDPKPAEPTPSAEEAGSEAEAAAAEAVVDEKTEAEVEAKEEEEEPYKHKGIYLRIAAGPGYSHFSTSYPDHSFTLSGASVVPELVMGYAIIEDLELTLGLSGTIMVEPNLDFSANDLSESISHNNMVALVIGGGVTYYMPYNLFIAGSIGFTYMKLGLNNSGMDDAAEGTLAEPLSGEAIEATAAAYEAVGKHRLGVAVQAQFGKEWWVSEIGGLGFSAQYQFYAFPKSHGQDTADKIGGSDVTWLGHTASLLMTMSLN